MFIWFCLVLALIGGNSAFTITKLEDLGLINGVPITKVNIGILGYNIKATMEINQEASLCDKYIITKAEGFGFRMGNKPKGNCHNCCPIQTTDVKLKLYTKQHSDRPLILPLKRRKRARYANLNRYTNIVIYIPGFTEITEIGSSQIIKDAYLSRHENYTIILVDWSNLTSFPWYMDAVVNTHYTARVLARFLESYSDAGIISLAHLHLVGFSLGAHVAGFVGKYLRGDLRISRITGLDPAYPGFLDETGQYRLNKDDANFVDVIHTDAGNFGYTRAIGHLDFFPNGGTYYQPGCDYHHLHSTMRLTDIVSCSHNLVYRLYAESVRSPYNFPAVKCSRLEHSSNYVCNNNEVVYMGFAASRNNSGSYFLKTNKESPYGRSEFDIRSSEV